MERTKTSRKFSTLHTDFRLKKKKNFAGIYANKNSHFILSAAHRAAKF